MKKSLALGLAAAMAVTVSLASGDASARPMWMMHPHGPMFFHPHPFFRPAPFFFGFSFGPSYPAYPYARYELTPHQQWCVSHYRTYSLASDTFHPTRNSTAVCIAPFDRYPYPY